jgi:hypothetical protein
VPSRNRSMLSSSRVVPEIRWTISGSGSCRIPSYSAACIVGMRATSVWSGRVWSWGEADAVTRGRGDTVRGWVLPMAAPILIPCSNGNITYESEDA